MGIADKRDSACAASPTNSQPECPQLPPRTTHQCCGPALQYLWVVPQV